MFFSSSPNGEFECKTKKLPEDEGNYTHLRISMFIFFTQYYYSDCIKEAEIGQTRSTHGVNDKCI